MVAPFRTACAYHSGSPVTRLILRGAPEVTTIVLAVTHDTTDAGRKPAGALRIAQLVPPVESVPPSHYGGLERVVSALTEELTRRGHRVTLFASGDSRTSATLAPIVDTAIWHHARYRDPRPFAALALDMAYGRADEFDVIHNHMEFLAFPLARAHPETPTISTLHGRMDFPEYEPLYRRFASLPLVSISDAQRAPLPWLNWTATVYNGVEVDRFDFQPRHHGYLAFLGRIAPEKGLDTAIRVARRAGMPIKIAARMPLEQAQTAEAQRDWQYYREVIRPLLREPGVEYIGEVSEAEKSAFLGSAAALLFPICWPEPFGLVMVEALACGTPVLALRYGSVPEVIDHGASGFIADGEDGLVQAVDRLGDLNRARCRSVAEARFSATTMTDGYERVYRSILAEPAAGVARASLAAAAPSLASGPVL